MSIHLPKPNGLTLAAIHPQKGAKYSPNLYKWLSDQQHSHRALTAQVYRDDRGVLWIGDVDDLGWLSGSTVYGVLTNGQNEPTVARRLGVHHRALELLKGFWADYALVGRCAIDVAHTVAFQSDESRWQMVSASQRQCRWCGQVTQTLRTLSRLVTETRWETATAEHAPSSPSASPEATSETESDQTTIPPCENPAPANSLGAFLTGSLPARHAGA